METIRNYLDAMFANMPNTPEVIKAKSELLSMMEDKYNELIAEGESENTAIGTVISEFGNLDDLAEDLGLTKEVEETHEREIARPRRFVSADEVNNFITDSKNRALLVGIGVLLCITSVIPPIIVDSLNYLEVYEGIGVVTMFLFIAIAVGLFVYSGSKGSEWDFLKKEPCQIEMSTAKKISDMKSGFKTTYAVLTAIGVILCTFCWGPVAVTENDVFSCFLFVFVGIGVFIFIYTGGIMGSYDTLLKLNDSETISGSYGRKDNEIYVNKTATTVMEVYWTTITCIYLIISFITFNWSTTWIIWPIAAIVHKILKITLKKED